MATFLPAGVTDNLKLPFSLLQVREFSSFPSNPVSLVFVSSVAPPINFRLLVVLFILLRFSPSLFSLFTGKNYCIDLLSSAFSYSKFRTHHLNPDSFDTFIVNFRFYPSVSSASLALSPASPRPHEAKQTNVFPFLSLILFFFPHHFCFLFPFLLRGYQFHRLFLSRMAGLTGVVSCQICEREYSEEPSFVPRILSGQSILLSTSVPHPNLPDCGHTLCTECAQRIAKGSLLACPFDRVQTSVKDGDVRNLKKNFSILQIKEDEMFRKKQRLMTVCNSSSRGAQAE